LSDANKLIDTLIVSNPRLTIADHYSLAQPHICMVSEYQGLRTTRRQTNLPTTNSPTDQLTDKPTRWQSNLLTIQLAEM